MFNALCLDALGEKPADVKSSLLGIKNAKSDTKVSLAHLMTLIEKHGFKLSFRVNYLKEDKPAPAAPIETPNFQVGLKEDPIITEMKEQAAEVSEGVKPAVAATPPWAGNWDKSADKPAVAAFNPDNIPEFKI